MKTCVVLIRDRRGKRDAAAVTRSQILYEQVVRPAVESVGLVCARMDPHDFGINDAHLFNLLESADAMIVDASAESMDYLYSLGVRHALTDKPTLIIVETDYVPFDIKSPRGVIHVRRGSLDRDESNRLRHEIESLLESVVALPDESYSPVRTALQQLPRVFLSYAHAAAESVLAVDQWLRDRGARVDVDERNFIAGRDIREESIRHVKRAGKVVCFYSESSADRYYPKLERRLTEEIERELQDGGEAKSVLVYFRLDDSELPAESSHRLAINAWNMRFEDACNNLWRHLLERSAEPRPIALSKYQRKAPWQKKD
jgi:TIR domain